VGEVVYSAGQVYHTGLTSIFAESAELACFFYILPCN
jgi:hypothetical protein